MSGVTDADREKAWAVVGGMSPDHAYVDEFIYDGEAEPLREAIAAALAVEREEVRAPFREMADHYLSEARKRGLPRGGDLAMIAAAMRRALGDAE